MANPIITSLPAYVEQNKSELIAKSLLTGKTVEYLNLMTGVNSPTTLNDIVTEVTFADGSNCGFDATDTTTLTQRVLTPAVLKVNTTFCDKKLLNTYLTHEVKVGAGRETLPFEEKFTGGIVDGVKEGIEKMVWQGDSTQGNQCDGFIKILAAAGAGTITVSEASGTTATKTITDTYMAMPANIVDKEDAVVFVSESMYRKYIQELVAANMYHHDATYGNQVYPIPGTSVRVIAVNGLNEADHEYAVAGRLSNFYYGVDMANDAEEFDLWYSKDDQIWKLAINFAAGVQVAYPNEVVLTTVA